ncbi:MAG: FMN-binding negative transcriptional regulator [Labilithrix sp.]|nr:FMN-binding negative transcriptional regulator [Labilithrix sp.]MBX3224125.1 FMN-binding negative transcriptional regulator [Labilithrix sp.]
MYLPRTFDGAAHRELTLSLMRTHPLATVIAQIDGELEVAHVPLLVAHEEPLRLSGHVARANPIAKHVLSEGAVTVVFHGPEAYVSAAWYAEPALQVPTWNYAVVHARGRLERLDDDGLRAQLDDMARAFETEGGWSTALPEPAFLAELRGAIVGFTVHVDDVKTKVKMSQNRSAEDHARVLDALAASSRARDGEVAALMRRIE